MDASTVELFIKFDASGAVQGFRNLSQNIVVTEGDVANLIQKVDGLTTTFRTSDKPMSEFEKVAQKLKATIQENADAFARAQVEYDENLASINGVRSGTQLADGAMKGATDSTKGFSNEIANLRNTISVARSAFDGFRNSVMMFNPLIQEADRLLNLSNATGESVSSLVILERAMFNCGASGEKAGQIFGRLARLIDDAKPGSPVEKAFHELGISLDEFAGMGAIEKLKTLQEEFAKIEDQTKKSALAMKLFGTQGTGMLALILNATSLTDAREDVGTLGSEMQRLAPVFGEVKRNVDAVSTAVQVGFIKSLSALSGPIKIASTLIANMPVKWLAGAIMLVSGSLAVGATAASIKVSQSLASQAKAWLTAAAAARAHTAAIQANTAASVANAGLNLGAGIGGKGKIGLGRGAAYIGGALAADYAITAATRDSSPVVSALGNIGSNALTGAAVGATIGSVVPVIGTGVGAIGGAAVAGVGTAAYEALNYRDKINEAVDPAAANKAANDRKQARDLATIEAAATKAEGPLQKVTEALRAWNQAQDESTKGRAAVIASNTMRISDSLGMGYESDPTKFLAEIEKKMGDLKAERDLIASRNKGGTPFAGDAARAPALTDEITLLASQIEELTALANQKKQLAQSTTQQSVALLKSEQAKELEELQNGLKNKTKTQEEYNARRVAMLEELHKKEAKLDTADTSQINTNNREAEMLRLKRELETTGKSSVGTAEAKDFRQTDAYTRIGLGTSGSSMDSSVTYQRGILAETKALRQEMRGMKDAFTQSQNRPQTTTWARA